MRKGEVMLITAKLIGVAIILIGVAILFLPDTLKKVLGFWKEGSRIYGVGVFRVLAGLVFFIAAPGSHLVGGTVAVGFLFFLAGAVIFVAGPEKIKALIAVWAEMPLVVCRIMGLIAAVFGTLILYVL